MIVTQGVLKKTNVYGITFVDKYSDIKTILSHEEYNSKFDANIYETTSQTSTVLVDDNSYYNIVDDCSLINCNVENGRFTNCSLIGNSEKTNYINDGVFSGCTFTNYIINNGRFIDCVIDYTNTWNTGYWENTQGNTNFDTIWLNGVWNSGVFNNPHGWHGGTFNGGTFVQPAIWFDGIANGGTFSGITWHNGLVRNAEFIDNCTFNDGTFNDGTFKDSTFNGGVFNNGNLINSNINGGIINNGNITSCRITGSTEINGGNFENDIIYDCNVHNIDANNLAVYGGNFYNGSYRNSTFYKCDIFNGVYDNNTFSGNIYYNIYEITGITIHNGIFRNSTLYYLSIQNGNFVNCESNHIIWYYGVYTDGKMLDSLWYDGYWNDGLFESISNFNNAIGSITIDVAIPTIGTTTTTTTTTTTDEPIIPTLPLSATLTKKIGNNVQLYVTGGVAPYQFVIGGIPSPPDCGELTFTPSIEEISNSYITISYDSDGYDVMFTVTAEVTDSTLQVVTTNELTIYGCLVPETLITMSDNTLKQIKDLSVGDYILTLDSNYNVTETIVTYKSYHLVDMIININNNLLKSSDSHIHLIKINEELVKTIAYNLKVGDILINHNGDEVIINSIEVETINQEVINISTEYGTYIANGILTHNKYACL